MTNTITATTKNNNAAIKIWIGNLAAYNAGILRGEWVTLPVSDEDLQAVYARIGGEEHAIMDYSTDIDGLKIGEYDDIDELNEAAEAIADFDGTQLEAFGAFLKDGCSLSDAVGHTENNDFTYYADCFNMADVAQQYCDDCGILDRIPDDLQCYFDFEAYGRDMEIEGTFYEVNGGYVELIY